MTNIKDIQFSEVKQGRSQQTLDDLMEAAFAIVEGADPDAFTSRSLSKKSGYALGTLHKRLASIENVFLWAIQEGHKNQLEKLCRITLKHDENKPVLDLIEHMVDASFAAIQQVGPKVIRFFESKFMRKNGLPPDFFGYLDALASPYMQAAQKDKTGTFRVMTENELRLTLRSMLMLVERPFVDGDVIAGTPEHRAIAIENLMRLLGSNQSKATPTF